MTNNITRHARLEALSLKTYGPKRDAVGKEYMNRDQVIAMSPLGSTQPTDISKRYASHRQSLPPILKKALQYLYPARNLNELPPKSKYDSMVRKMSNYSIHQSYENSPRNESLSTGLEKKEKKKTKEPKLLKKMSGIFDFPNRGTEPSPRLYKKERSKSAIKLPTVRGMSKNENFSGTDYINCINYTGEAESEYLKSQAAQTEYRKLYELMLIDTGLYSELRIRNQNKQRVHYRRMPV